MVLRSLSALGAAALALGLSMSAHAIPFSPTVSITDGDKLFNNFTCNLTSGGTTVGSCAGLDIIALPGASVGVRFQENFQAQGINAQGAPAPSHLDIALSYDVTVLDPNQRIVQLSGALTGSIFAAGDSINVSEVARSGGVDVGHISQSLTALITDLTDPPFEIPFDVPLTGAFTTLHITKDIGLSAVAGGLVSLSIIDQDFQQRLPEPASLLLLATVLGGLGFAARRKQ